MGITPKIVTFVDTAAPDEVIESVASLLQELTPRVAGSLVHVHEMVRVGRVEMCLKDWADGKVAFSHTRWGAYHVGLVEMSVQDRHLTGMQVDLDELTISHRCRSGHFSHSSQLLQKCVCRASHVVRPESPAHRRLLCPT